MRCNRWREGMQGRLKIGLDVTVPERQRSTRAKGVACVLFFCLLSVSFLVLPANAADWYVNDTSTASDSYTYAGGSDTQSGTAALPFRSIKQAMDSAAAGDTIFVDAGIYDSYVTVSPEETAGVNITKDHITLIGKDSAATIIDPQGSSISTMFGIYADSQQGLVIKNLAVTGAQIGIYFVNVDTSEIRGDSLSSAGSNGISLINNSDSNTIAYNLIAANSAQGINVSGCSNDTLIGNIVTGHNAPAVYLENFQGGVLANNIASGNGQALELMGCTDVRVYGNYVYANNSGEGLVLFNGERNVFYNNLIKDNLVGVSITASSGNFFYQNTFDSNSIYQINISGASLSDTFQKNNFRPSPTNPDSVVTNTSTNTHDFSRNWWDTTDEVTIEKRTDDTATTSSLTFRPYRLGQVDTTTGADTTAPLPPIGVTCTAATGYITVTWAIPAVSEETNGGSVGYAGAKIYRRTTADTTNWSNAANLVWTASISATSWDDTGATTGGTTYYYRLTSFDTATYVNQSFFTDTKSATAASSSSPTTWYVNDTATSADSFTYAGGADTSGGAGTRAAPYRSVVKALLGAKAGDTIFVDAGFYDSYTTLTGSETIGIRIDTNNISIIGKDSGSTIIDPPGDSTNNMVVGVYADTQSGLLIRGIGFTGVGIGIAFFDVDSSAVISDSFVRLANGVYLSTGSETNLVSGNVIETNTSPGLKLEASSGNTIKNNLIRANAGAISIQGSNGIGSNGNVFDGNIVSWNTGLPAVNLQTGNNNTFVNNTFSANADIGLEIGDSGNIAESNVMSSNQLHGLLVLAGLNVVRYNRIVGNAQAGLALSGDTNVIQQNEITANDTGLWLNTYSAGNRTGNVVMKNNIYGNTTNNVYNDAGAVMTLTRNYWGTADEVTIQSKMGDTVSAFRPYRFAFADTRSGADTTAPLPPIGVTCTAATGYITVTWAIPAINEETNGGSVGYSGAKIYRLTGVDTTNWSNTANLVRTASSTETQWNDTGATTAGTTYYYRLTSFDAATFVNQSFFTDTKSATVASSGNTTWYVNDTYNSSTDSFTYAGGADTSGGAGTRAAPYRSVAKVMQSAKSGDTIYVDAGLYADTYVFVSSTETAAFEIDTDYVTIIGKDSNATVIDPPGDSAMTGVTGTRLYGIYATDRVGITIKNLGIMGAGFGIYFVNVDSSNIIGDSISNNSTAISLTTSLTSGSDSNTIINNLVQDNVRQGITITINWTGGGGPAGQFNVVRQNTISRNLSGVEIEAGATSNIVANNIISSNDSSGVTIAAGDGANLNVVIQNEISGNDTGILFPSTAGGFTLGTGNVVTKNNFTGNRSSNIYNKSSGALTLSGNWWGTTDEVTIDTDFEDTANVFIPYRLGPVDTSSGADTTAPGLPASVSVTADSIGQIVVSWTIPTVNEETNGGTVGYAGAKIYRQTNTVDTTNWANSANLVWMASSSATSWTDTGVTPGNTYYYRLTSFDAATFVNQSFFTDTKSAKPTRSVWYVNDTYSSSTDSFTYAGGSDTGGDGSASKPYRSAAKALQYVKSYDTIYIDAGLYADTYVVIVTGIETAAFKFDTDYITIIGKDSNATVINPPGDSKAWVGGSSFGTVGIYASSRKGLSIRNLGIVDAGCGIFFTGVVSSSITGDSISRSAVAISLNSSSDTNIINNNLIQDNEQVGINIAVASSQFNTIVQNTISRNMVGITLGGNGSSSLTSNVIRNNIISSSDSAGIVVTDAETNTITLNEITNNDTGIIFTSRSIGVFLDGNVVTRNNFVANRSSHIFSPASATFTLTRNWFGTTDEYTIDTEFEDTTNVFIPYRLGPVDTSPGADTTAPGLPANVTLDTKATSYITLTWTIPTVNEETNGGSVGYSGAKIYRLTSADTTNWANSANLVRTTSSTETTWTDTMVTGGLTYYYRMTSFDAATYVNQSFFTDTKWATATSAGKVVFYENGAFTDDVDTFLTRDILFIEVRDSDENRASGTVETVAVTVYVGNGTTEFDSAGLILDTETIVLTESGANTAIFRSDTITLTDTKVPAVSDLTISWGRGDTLFVRYLDIDDASDTAWDTALALEIATTAAVQFYEDNGFTDSVDTYATRDVMRVQVQDTDENRNPQKKDTILVIAYIGLDATGVLADTETIVLTETAETSGIFRSGDINMTDTQTAASNDGFLTWASSDTLHVNYADLTGTPETAYDTALLTDTAAQSNSGPTWYVNDTSTSGDGFTSARGSDTDGVGTATSPYRTILHALRQMKSGHTLYVDAGIYDSYVEISSSETAGVEIDTDNITIIGKDSNATVIDPPGANSGSGLYGIFADTQSGLTIKNLGVTGAVDGIHFENVDSSTVVGDSVSSAAYGITLRAGSETNTVTGSQFNSNMLVGVNIYVSSGNVVTNNAIHSNGSYGLWVSSAQKNIAAHNSIRSNGSAGIWTEFSDSNIAYQNEITGNDTGVWITGTSSGNILTKNNLTGSLSSLVYNQSPYAQVATRNWWGTTDEVAIDTDIVDTYDVGTFFPYRLGKVDTSIGGDTTAPGLPASVSLDSSTPATIKLTWTIPVINEETNGGSVSYAGLRVYRLKNQADTANWGNIANLVWVASSTDTTWTDTTVSGGSVHYYRLTSIDNATYINQSFFADTRWSLADTANSGPAWFVNDTYTNADSFTYAGGSDTSWGDGSRTRPYRSVAKAMQKVKQGDTVYIDAGLYADTYVVVSSAETAAFKIDTDYITVVGKDSNATVIDPPGASTDETIYGIYADTQTGLVIRDLGVTGASGGIAFFNVTSSTIMGDSLCFNDVGVYLANSSAGNTVTGVTARYNSIGIYIDSGSSNIITNNQADSNSNFGIHIDSGASNTIRGNTADSNSVAGIYLNFSRSNTLETNAARFNSSAGIHLASSRSNTLYDNSADSNVNYGFYLTDSDTNTLTGNTAHSNSAFGIRLVSSSQNVLTRNAADSNVSAGLSIDTGKSNAVSGNRFRGRSSGNPSGILLAASDSNRIVQNDILSNVYGILINGTSGGNMITRNNFTGNSSYNALNQAGLSQTFTRNWWDTTDEVSISAKFADTASIFIPYRLGPVDTASGADTTAPGLPASVSLDTTTASQITLTWTIPTVNEETNGGTVGYAGAKIYRSTTVDTTNWANSSLLAHTSNSTATNWADTTVTVGVTYYYRLTSFDAASFVNQSFFTDTKWATAVSSSNTTTIWFVNDTYVSASDSFTYAGGSDTGGIGTRSAPYRSVAKVMQSAKSGDTVYVDAGLYTETYVIVSSTETAAFKIDTDNITIIGKDSGSTVFDPPGDSSIRNLYGIYASADKVVIKNVGVTGAGYGIYLSGVDTSTIQTDSVAGIGYYGIVLSGADSNIVTGCVATSVDSYGFYVEDAGNNTLGGNTATSNRIQGIYMHLSTGNILNGNTSKSNSSYGIYIESCTGNIITGNTLTSNGTGGLELYSGSNQNTVTGNIITSNSTEGIMLDSSSANTIKNNNVSSNTSYGIRIRSSDTNVILQNNIKSNDTGVHISGLSLNNVFTKNNLAGATSHVLNLSSAQTFSRNYFGTTDEFAIDDDFADTSSAFRPYRLDEVDTTAAGDSTAPLPPIGVTCTAATGYITVTWAIPTVNEETNGGSVGYAGARIYRLTVADTNNWGNDSSRVWIASSSATTWNDTGATTAGATYYYRLISFDAATYINHSYFTDTKSATVASSTGSSSGTDSIFIVSGNHQLGTYAKALTDSLVVKVIDTAGTARANVPVRFTITQEPSESAFGEADADESDPFLGDTSGNMTSLVYTDTSGMATETFTLGDLCGLYRVSATMETTPYRSETFYIYANAVDIPKATWKMVGPNIGASSAAVSAGSLDFLLWTGATDLTGSSAFAEVDGFAWDEAAGVSAGLSDYDALSTASSIERGRSYWMYGSDHHIHVGEASPARSFDTVTIALTAGWHMISSGQPFYINWDDGVRFDTNAATESAKYYPESADYYGIIDNVVYWYNGSGYYWGPDTNTSYPDLSDVQLKPMIGFWIFTNVACTMTVYPNPDIPADSATKILSQSPALAARYTGGGNDADWLVRLTAQAGDRVDFQNYVGVKPTAEAAARAGVYDPPAAAGKYVTLGIQPITPDGGGVVVGPRLAASYVEPIATAKAWKINIASDMDSVVTLSWENVSSIPAKYAAYLIGGAAGVVDLRKTSSVSLPYYGAAASGSLTLAVGLPEYLAAFLASPLSKDQTFVYPNPGPDGTTGSMTFGYNLQNAADATIRIFDVGGKLVKELKGTGNVGNNTIVWDTTNKNGQKVGSGVYIYIITSGGNKIVDKLAIVR